jgi:hypothetical protein
MVGLTQFALRVRDFGVEADPENSARWFRAASLRRYGQK